MGWFEDVAENAAHSVKFAADHIAEHGPRVAEAVGAFAQGAAKDVGGWVENEAKPSIENAAKTARTWAENEALPSLQHVAAEFGQWVHDDFEQQVAKAKEFLQAHPEIFLTIAGASLSLLAAEFVAPNFIALQFLEVLGFTDGGVVAGTIAATIHSILGDVQAGTIFAILQSAAAGGIGIAVVQSIVQALIAALFTISGILGIGTLEDLIRQIGDATGEFMASFFSSGGEDDVPLLGASEHVKQE